MTKGTLDSGFEFEIDETRLDDMRFLEDLAAMDENPLLMPRVIEKMLGKEQKERLYTHLEKDGKVSIADFSAAISEIFEKSSKLKN